MNELNKTANIDKNQIKLNIMKTRAMSLREIIDDFANNGLPIDKIFKIITELNLKIQKLELKSSEIAASSNRDKRAQESQYTTQLLSFKNQYQNQIDDVKIQKID